MTHHLKNTIHLTGLESHHLVRMHVFRRTKKSDEGFTLIELLIVVTILPLIVGAISVALLGTFRLQAGVSDRLSASGDAEMISANFFRDVQSATSITTEANSSPECGSGAQVLGLQWPGAIGPTVVSYVLAPNGVVTSNGTQDKLVRQLCTYENYSNPVVLQSTTVISYNTPSTLAVQITGNSCSPSSCTSAASLKWISAAGIQSVNLVVNEAAINSADYSTDPSCTTPATYCYTLAAAPRYGSMAGGSKYPNVVPLQLLAGGSTNVVACSSNGSRLSVNGLMVLNSSSVPIIGLPKKKNVSATAIDTVYNYNGVPPTGVSSSTPITTISQPLADPLMNLPAPNPATLNKTPAIGQPGVYTSPLSGTVQLSGGIYYLENGINLTGNDTITVAPGAGVLLYVAGGSVSMSGTSNLDLSPLSSPPSPLQNLVLWQARSDTNPLNLQGNADGSSLGGIVYAPGAGIAIGGTPNFTAGDILAQSFACNGNGSINITG